MNINIIRRWSRNLHRDLSYLFTGMLLVYAISGIAMNHLRTRDPHFDIEVQNYTVELPPISSTEINKKYVIENYLQDIDQTANYTKHYFPKPNTLKVFLKGGSNLYVDLETNEVLFEEKIPRHIMSAMAKLHYNPSKLWTIFSDIFSISLIIIILTGIIMIKGKKGLIGIGGIELLIGILIPLAFILL